MRNYLPRFFFALAILVAFSLSAFGQGTGVTGSISGAVTDQNGAVVAGATVMVQNKANPGVSTVTTSDTGTFTVSALVTGVLSKLLVR